MFVGEEDEDIFGKGVVEEGRIEEGGETLPNEGVEGECLGRT